MAEPAMQPVAYLTPEGTDVTELRDTSPPPHLPLPSRPGGRAEAVVVPPPSPETSLLLTLKMHSSGAKDLNRIRSHAHHGTMENFCDCDRVFHRILSQTAFKLELNCQGEPKAS